MIMGVRNPEIYVLAISERDISSKPFSWREEIVYSFATVSRPKNGKDTRTVSKDNVVEIN
jgi:hypothetical protein